MAEGVRRDARAMVVAQAALVWALGDVDLQDFIATGRLAASADNYLDYDPNLRAAIVAEIQPHLARKS